MCYGNGAHNLHVAQNRICLKSPTGRIVSSVTLIRLPFEMVKRVLKCLTETNHYWKAYIYILRCSCMVVKNMEFYNSWFATCQATICYVTTPLSFEAAVSKMSFRNRFFFLIQVNVLMNLLLQMSASYRLEHTLLLLMMQIDLYFTFLCTSFASFLILELFVSGLCL